MSTLYTSKDILNNCSSAAGSLSALIEQCRDAIQNITAFNAGTYLSTDYELPIGHYRISVGDLALLLNPTSDNVEQLLSKYPHDSIQWEQYPSILSSYDDGVSPGIKIVSTIDDSEVIVASNDLASAIAQMRMTLEGVAVVSQAALDSSDSNDDSTGFTTRLNTAVSDWLSQYSDSEIKSYLSTAIHGLITGITDAAGWLETVRTTFFAGSEDSKDDYWNRGLFTGWNPFNFIIKQVASKLGLGWWNFTKAVFNFEIKTIWRVVKWSFTNNSLKYFRKIHNVIFDPYDVYVLHKNNTMPCFDRAWSEEYQLDKEASAGRGIDTAWVENIWNYVSKDKWLCLETFGFNLYIRYISEGKYGLRIQRKLYTPKPQYQWDNDTITTTWNDVVTKNLSDSTWIQDTLKLVIDGAISQDVISTSDWTESQLYHQMHYAQVVASSIGLWLLRPNKSLADFYSAHTTAYTESNHNCWSSEFDNACAVVTMASTTATVTNADWIHYIITNNESGISYRFYDRVMTILNDIGMEMWGFNTPNVVPYVDHSVGWSVVDYAYSGMFGVYTDQENYDNMVKGMKLALVATAAAVAIVAIGHGAAKLGRYAISTNALYAKAISDFTTPGSEGYLNKSKLTKAYIVNSLAENLLGLGYTSTTTNVSDVISAYAQGAGELGSNVTKILKLIKE